MTEEISIKEKPNGNFQLTLSPTAMRILVSACRLEIPGVVNFYTDKDAEIATQFLKELNENY